MHSGFNQRITNSLQATGNNAQYIASLKNLIAVNDGTQSFIPRTVDCHDHNCPYGENDETRLQITHGDHDISNLSDGFITFRVQCIIYANGIDTNNFADTEELFKIFVGFKDSNQILDKLQIYCNGVNTGYNQNECLREGFAYSVIKPKQEKMTKKYIHSPYENVQKYSPSVCGTYINMKDLIEGKDMVVEFEVILPYDDILALEAFDMFPNAVVGDIELRYYVKHWGLVWCEVDPHNVKDYKEFMQSSQLKSDFDENPSATFHHQFTQINQDNLATVSVTSTTDGEKNMLKATGGKVTINCRGMTVTVNKANMFGHGVTATAMQSIQNTVQSGIIIPAQELEYNAFPLPPTKSGIQSNINVPLNQVTCMSVVFPKRPNDRTVFENPCYHNLQLIVNGKNFPDEVLDTTSARFLQYQMIASDLHRGIECTKEFEDSLTMAKNDRSGIPYTNTLSDGTSFMWNVQTERNNAGYCYDGLDSGGQNVQIQIRGGPIFDGKNDTYYNMDRNENPELSRHPPPPQIWFCKDTHWVLQQGAMTYVRNEVPEGSQAA